LKKPHLSCRKYPTDHEQLATKKGKMRMGIQARLLTLCLLCLCAGVPVAAEETDATNQEVASLRQRVEQLESERSLKIFGQAIQVILHGQLQLDVMHDFNAMGLDPDGGFTNEFITGEIPARGTEAAQMTHRTGFSVNASTVFIGFRTHTGWGELEVLSQVNFMGNLTGGPAFQLYQAYGKLGNFLGGKAWSTFTNLASMPNTLDYEGPNAIPEVQAPMMRWDQPLPCDLWLALALEAPRADMKLPTGVSALNQVPDVILRLQYKPKWATIWAAGLYRRLKAKGNGFDDGVNGWGAQLSGSVDTFGRDSVQFGAVYGEGLGAYIQDTQGYGLDAAPTFTGATTLSPIPAFSAWAGYQHFWTGTLQSNASYGYVKLKLTDSQPGDTYKSTTYASLNIIYTPIRFLSVGVEYIYGERLNKDNGYGNDHRVQFSTQVNF